MNTPKDYFLGGIMYCISLVLAYAIGWFSGHDHHKKYGDGKDEEQP